VRLFILFLLMTAFICLYEAWLSFELARMHYGQLTVAWKQQLTQARRPLVPLPANVALSHLMQDLHFAVPLGMFCGLMGTVVLLFALYHIYLVARNTTTNETFKWQVICDVSVWCGATHRHAQDVLSSMKWYKRRQLARARLLAEREAGRAPPAKERPVTNPSDSTDGKKKGDAGDVDSDAEIDGVQFPTAEQLGNIYNRGVINNFNEVLFPPSLHAKPKSQ
jgi:hypothetical protein